VNRKCHECKLALGFCPHSFACKAMPWDRFLRIQVNEVQKARLESLSALGAVRSGEVTRL